MGMCHVCSILSWLPHRKSRPSKEQKDSDSKRIVWFEKCLDKIGKIKNIKSVAFPYKIGCGLAGGDWEIYEQMLIDFSNQHSELIVKIISNESKPEGSDDGVVTEPVREDDGYIEWLCQKIKDICQSYLQISTRGCMTNLYPYCITVKVQLWTKYRPIKIPPSKNIAGKYS